MKYMLIMRATDEAAARMAGTDFDEVIATAGRYKGCR